MNMNNKHAAQESATTSASRIPPHVAWPLFVVLLLVIGVGSSLAIVFAARSDGGAKVIENYYEKAIAWDSTSKLTRESDAAGWVVSMDYVPPASSTTTGKMEIVFIDNAGQPITGLAGSVSAYRPQHSRALGTAALTADTTKPGTYFHAFGHAASGIWDFEIHAQQDSFQFHKVIRKELIF